jgi:hypothetical protein
VRAARLRFTRAAAALACAVALAGLAGGGCDKLLSCRPGTVFVNLDFGQFVTATQLRIDVSIDGGAAQPTTRDITPGTRGGSVEVEFPNNYPAGRTVTIVVMLTANGTPLAVHREDVEATGECEAVSVVFVPGDGLTGAGGNGGSTGGDGGRGGAAGAGTGGTAGATGVAGSGGTAGSGVGGAAGRGGTGGAAGTGVVGTGGAAGRGGTGGAAGRGGTGGGAGGRGGTGPTCVPTGAEICFNNLDDDCDMRIDCADSDCAPAVAQCVALDAAMGKIGFLSSPTAACPAGYTDMTVLWKGLMPGACTGCSCTPPPVVCSASVASYPDATQCNSASNSGVPAGTLSTAEGCRKPTWDISAYTAYGVIAGAFTATATGSCTAAGSPVPPGTPTWSVTNRFCATTTVGGGCATGQVCVPANASARCQLADSARACAAGQIADAWYTGYTGAQTCGACSCSQTAAGNCNNMTIQIGSDYTCAPAVATLTASARRACFPGGVYEPGVQFMGTATRPTCQGSSAGGMGTLATTGQRTVCCLPSAATP